MHDPISQLNAALEGRYTIERELGQERLFSWSAAQLSLHPDGDRFVSTESASTDDAPAPVERHFVIVNWFEELKQRMGR